MDLLLSLKNIVLLLYMTNARVQSQYMFSSIYDDGKFYFSKDPDYTQIWLQARFDTISKAGMCDLGDFKYEIPDKVIDKNFRHIDRFLIDDEFAVVVKQTSFNCIPEVCFDLSGAFWYGGAELHTQRWPMRDMSLPLQPYVTNDLVPANVSLGNVIERMWINSDGAGVVEKSGNRMVHSYNAHNSNEMCFRPVSECQQDLKTSYLDFKIFKTVNIADTFSKISQSTFKLPSGTPDIRMMKSPIWSTWAKYKVDINEEKVLQYAEEILKHGFSNSQLEIDDMFSSKYGEFDFVAEKFKDPAGMVQKLKDSGFRVTVWITPFANLDSNAFKEGMEKGYWLTDTQGQVPALVKWWQGIGATLDVTNDEAVTWFLERLNKMKQKYGIDSFKFDAGEVTYVPSSWKPDTATGDPTWYTTKYVEAVSKMGPMIEVRCGYRTQEFPVFVRMGDKESRWGYDNGLRTLIPTVLTMGILGYPYVLPDMIGGNGYDYGDGDNPLFRTVLPDRELYIRWLELTAYLPAMQFSFVPWQYDEEVVEIAQKYVKIHEDVVTPVLVQAAKVAMKTGSPLIRPLWWIAPKDTNALECDSEFLVAGALLVAPVMEPGARERDVYLPDGVWEDNLRQDTVLGGKWLRGYKAELDQIPTFNLLQ